MSTTRQERRVIDKPSCIEESIYVILFYRIKKAPYSEAFHALLLCVCDFD